MINIKNNKKTAFTLMEIGLSLLIISILLMLCIPLITKQMKKTEEYNYYLAYKTVEKIGSQIVAFGDPEGDIPTVVYDSNQLFPLVMRDMIAQKVSNLKNIFTPVAYAQKTSEIVAFPSYEYDYMRVCLGNPNVVKDYDIYAGNTWTLDEVQNTLNQRFCDLYTNDLISKHFKCNKDSVSFETVYNLLKVTPYNAAEYCSWLATQCGGTSDYRVIDVAEQTSQTNQAAYGQCRVMINDPDKDLPIVNLTESSNTENGKVMECEDYGYVGMTNSASGSNIACICDDLHPVVALNNTKVCCATPEDATLSPYAKKNGSCAYCMFGRYNEKTESCCPAHSFYSESAGHCVCEEGYAPNNAAAPTSCSKNASSCPAGSHLEDNVCKSNSPIISAERFCKLLAYNWNVSTSNCSTFTQSGDIYYNSELFNKITAGSTPYLSSKAVVGAFNQVEPNIIFANGLKLWILGDKAASIAGLSFNPDGYTPTVNTCYITSDSSETCTEPKYYSKIDDKCFAIEPGDGALKLGDARNCSASVDFADLMHQFEGYGYLQDPRAYAINGFTVFVDITGTKDDGADGGGGTMWKDVFPFYISSNGHVYPAYPLNAAKAKAGGEGGAGAKTYDSASLYQGGNSSLLSTDVFYYDIVNGKRKKISVYSSVPYARAMCFSMEISAFTPYCQNIGSKFRKGKLYDSIDKFVYSDDNPCWKHKCFVHIKRKVKFL